MKFYFFRILRTSCSLNHKLKCIFIKYTHADYKSCVIFCGFLNESCILSLFKLKCLEKRLSLENKLSVCSSV